MSADEQRRWCVFTNDILMSNNKSQINDAFDIAERVGFWVAQPADLAEGRNAHWITCFAGPGWDYRIVNFVEARMPIFRREKLTDFLAVYDGSLDPKGRQTGDLADRQSEDSGHAGAKGIDVN